MDFASELQARGYAFVAIREEETVLLRNFEALIEAVLQMPTSTVTRYDPLLEIGYKDCVDEGKKFFAVKHHGAPRALLSFGNDQLENQTFELYHCLRNIAERCLSLVCRSFGIAESTLLDLLDPENLPPAEFASSFLHLFRYDENGSEVSCPPHTDSGFLTVIPCSSAGIGLEILDASTAQWAPAERPGHVAVFAGETLALLSNFRFRAGVHRVVRDGKVRHSAPFQLRANPHAILDPTVLPDGSGEAIRVADFIL